jgi:hypothetical protein
VGEAWRTGRSETRAKAWQGARLTDHSSILVGDEAEEEQADVQPDHGAEGSSDHCEQAPYDEREEVPAIYSVEWDIKRFHWSERESAVSLER